MIQKADLAVLINDSQLRNALQNNYPFEYLPFYTEAAENSGLRLIYVSERSLLQDDQIEAFVWNSDTRTYEAGIYSIPTVVHNRSLFSSKNDPNIVPLLQAQGVSLYNEKTRFDKWEVHSTLSQNPDTAQYLPHTEMFSNTRQIRRLLDRFKTVYVKPRRGSLGVGIIRLSEVNGRVEVTRTVHRRPFHYQISKDNLVTITKRIGKRPYLIQEGISLLRLAGKPVDFRVSVQKGHDGAWTVSGVAAKIGELRAHATNLALGGQAGSHHKLLRAMYGKKQGKRLSEKIEDAALAIAQQLEGITHLLADLGLDMTITEQGLIRFIEANGRDLRITFRNAKLNDMWKRTYQNPILYGKYLLEQAHSVQEDVQ